MNLLLHPIANLIVGTILWKIDFIPSTELFLLFIFFSILIDLDHIIYFLIKHKTNLRNLIKDMKYHRKNMEPELYFFHSPEFNLLLLILSFFNFIFLLFLISNILHISLDIIEHLVYHKNLLWIKKWSFIYNLKRYKH